MIGCSQGAKNMGKKPNEDALPELKQMRIKLSEQNSFDLIKEGPRQGGGESITKKRSV